MAFASLAWIPQAPSVPFMDQSYWIFRFVVVAVRRVILRRVVSYQ